MPPDSPAASYSAASADDHMDLDSEIVPELVRSMHNRILNLEIKMKENNGKYLRQE